jgi:hypothetical protein
VVRFTNGLRRKVPEKEKCDTRRRRNIIIITIINVTVRLPEAVELSGTRQTRDSKTRVNGIFMKWKPVHNGKSLQLRKAESSLTN